MSQDETAEHEIIDPVTSDDMDSDAQDTPNTGDTIESAFAEMADSQEAKRLIEALLFSSKEPLMVEELADAVPDQFDVPELLTALQKDYEARGIVLENNGKYWAFRTASDLAERLTIERIEVKKLSRAGLETLAIIAYHQPVTRAEIEDIRGVAVAKGTIDALLELGWISPRGRKRAPGRPLMWGTTDEFLDHFGLGELEELPGVKELKDSGLLNAAPSLAEMEASEEDAEVEEAEESDDEIGDEDASEPEDENLEVEAEPESEPQKPVGDNVVPIR